jgi:4-hydroxy-tetrahydrodipicolinate synthase
MKEIKLWTALITPMNGDGSINYDDLEKMILRQADAGNGVLLIGSTGEGLALTFEEKKQVMKFTNQLKIDIPVMAGVGGFNLESQKEWIQYCNTLAIDAYLLVAPLYSKPGNEGQKAWFKDLMDVAEKPCMVYNIPSRTGVKITIEVLDEIKNHKNFWAVKEAGASLADYQEFREKCPDILFYSGDDGLLPFMAVLGCNGLVSVASNIWPTETRRYVEKSLNGDTESLFPVWKQAVDTIFSAPNPVAVKLLLKEKGLIENSTLRAPLTEKEISSLGPLLEADKQIINWYKTQTD